MLVSILFIIFLFIERGQLFNGWILSSEEGCPVSDRRGEGHGRTKRATGQGHSSNEYSALSSAECLKTCVKDANCYAFKYSGHCNIWDLSKKSECQVDTRGSEKILIKSTQCKILAWSFIFSFVLINVSRCEAHGRGRWRYS